MIDVTAFPVSPLTEEEVTRYWAKSRFRDKFIWIVMLPSLGRKAGHAVALPKGLDPLSTDEPFLGSGILVEFQPRGSVLLNYQQKSVLIWGLDKAKDVLTRSHEEIAYYIKELHDIEEAMAL